MAHDVIAAFVASEILAGRSRVLTYDEQSGFYDHVPPPKACGPDDIQPTLNAGSVQAAYDAYGRRVPLPALTHHDANAVPPFDMFAFDNPPDTSFR